MIDPVDTFHDLVKSRPKVLHKSPRALNFWIGEMTQAYGTVANDLRDLQAEHEVAKEKAEKYDKLMEEFYETMEMASRKIFEWNVHINASYGKLEAIKKYCETSLTHPYDGEWDTCKEILKIMGVSE